MRVFKRCKLVHIVCDECGRKFKPGFDKYGLPNGAGFELKDGTRIDVCGVCLDNIGRGLENNKEDKK